MERLAAVTGVARERIELHDERRRALRPRDRRQGEAERACRGIARVAREETTTHDLERGSFDARCEHERTTLAVAQRELELDLEVVARRGRGLACDDAEHAGVGAERERRGEGRDEHRRGQQAFEGRGHADMVRQPPMLEPRSARASITEMTELVLPQHSNAVGSAFGGTVLAWIDICGAICAQRHSGRVCVTASIDEVNFKQPIRVGDVVILHARVNAAFRTSLEVAVGVQVEDRISGHRRLSVDAFTTFVALGDDGKPVEIAPLLIETAEDERRAREATERRAARLGRRG